MAPPTREDFQALGSEIRALTQVIEYRFNCLGVQELSNWEIPSASLKS